jgi:hypothetical protein
MQSHITHSQTINTKHASLLFERIFARNFSRQTKPGQQTPENSITQPPTYTACKLETLQACDEANESNNDRTTSGGGGGGGGRGLCRAGLESEEDNDAPAAPTILGVAVWIVDIVFIGSVELEKVAGGGIENVGTINIDAEAGIETAAADDDDDDEEVEGDDTVLLLGSVKVAVVVKEEVAARGGGELDRC